MAEISELFTVGRSEPVVNENGCCKDTTYDLGTDSFKWSNVYGDIGCCKQATEDLSLDFRVASQNDSKNLFVVDVKNERIYIKGTDFDTVLGRLDKLENTWWKRFLRFVKVI